MQHRMLKAVDCWPRHGEVVANMQVGLAEVWSLTNRPSALHVFRKNTKMPWRRELIDVHILNMFEKI